MLRICRQCATEYDGKPGSTLCPSCVAANKRTTIRDRICRECGKIFPGGPRAWYCPTCRAERTRKQNRKYKAKGTQRPLGSIDLCVICGGEYIVNGSRQRYCPACAPDATKAADRQQALEWYSANGDPDQRRQLRQAHTADLRCVICGKTFKPIDSSITCSKECSAALTKRHNAEYERTHREERNKQQRARR